MFPMTNDTTLINARYAGRHSLSTMLAELERQKESKHDVVLDGETLMAVPRMVTEGNVINTKGLLLTSDRANVREHLLEGLAISEPALVQMGERVSPTIPSRFIRELATAYPSEAGALLTGLLNKNSKANPKGEKHLVRCLDNKVRAFLSNSFRIVDHIDILFKALEVAKPLGARPIECRLTDTKMHLKLVDFNVFDTLDHTTQTGHNWHTFGGAGNQDMLRRTDMADWINKPGKNGIDPNKVHPCITISNSETGHGSVNVSFGFFWSACCNGAIIEVGLRSVHLGSRKEVGILTSYAQDTQQSEAATVLLKIRDILTNAFDKKLFTSYISKAKAAATDRILSPTNAVDNILKASSLNASDRDALLSHFLRDYTPTRAGLVGALTRYAQDLPVEKATDLETFAGRLLIDAPFAKSTGIYEPVPA
jgi:hypothetical protein